MFSNVEKSCHNLKYTFYVSVFYTSLLTLASLLDAAAKEGKLKCPTCSSSVVFNSSPRMSSDGCHILTQSSNILGELRKAKEQQFPQV